MVELSWRNVTTNALEITATSNPRIVIAISNSGSVIPASPARR